MIRKVIHILPPQFRRRGLGVLFTLLLRTLLNMVGITLLIPVLALALEPDALTGEGWLAMIYTTLGFRSTIQFAWVLAALIVAFIAVKCLLNYLLAKVERRFIFDLYAALSRKLYLRYYTLGLHFIKQHNSAELNRNVNVVCMAFTAGVLKPAALILTEAMLFLLLFAALALYAPWASLLTLGIFIPVAWGYYRLVRQRVIQYGRAENQAQREKFRVVSETFRGYTDIELSNAFPMMLHRFEEATREVVATRSHRADLALLPTMLTEFGLAFGVAMLAAVSLSFGGENSPVLFGLFAVAALRLMPSVRNMMSAWATMRYERYSIDILNDAVNDAACAKPLANTSELPFDHTLTIRDLSFRYPDSEEWLFRDFNLTIHKGDRIGIRGTSGVGKSTLFHLLLGFYTPNSGSIEIDGTPLTPALQRSWLQRIGYVSQNLFLIDGSFAENVALGATGSQIDRKLVEKVLRTAQLGDLLDSLPDGIDTPIGEGGCRLSGGQRQRIGIARALYRKADLLLFDEATSALDDRTEQEINHSIDRLAHENSSLTMLIIAHRESSLTACNRIINLNKQPNHE